ncbi:rhodanese-like domain-containing protein [Ponticaulis sp.]|uniref:rhodanese-like domain-containing protein n=1 Tax=Ponticaulis sp. TaxID=2020902 RepID=UPI000C38EF8C|nr:rhodanese-like domain-containing protein [Ponticaulis sp.]MAJ09754.1 sulfurtransferase [Ponticaulis sp.]RPG17091.1 MAG: rhodanese-like domain-containing protein [Hyphomonadaceae bacterium TMED125]HBH88412.1 sulfurtransferase [Hyphomonadaceae bacterium]HBJ94516.1 sulfurtransferase [Hyphomonadaceae bacterium]
MSDGRDLPPTDIFEDLKAQKILLVDVREPAEFANERIHGALLHPLSTFEPKAIPTDGKRRVIFQCGSGKRSRMALDMFMKETGADAAHMTGGIGMWKTHNLPVVKINPATGQVQDAGRY